MRIFFLIAVFSLLVAPLVGHASDVDDDEQVVFFATVAHFDASNEEWVIPIHGWIYEPEDSVVRKAGIEKVLEETFELRVEAATRSNFDRRVNLLLVDNESGERIEIRIAGQRHVLNESEANGHFMDELRLSAATVEQFSQAGSLSFAACLDSDDTRSFVGHVLLWEPEGLTIISDIDDTVKVSEVSDHRKLVENTFFLDFVSVPGMAEQYQRWADEGADFQFVSSSPWQLYDPLNELLLDSGFPRAALSLKSIRLKDRTLLNLFKPGTETKPLPIEALLRRFPRRQFILVGDSGEQDPEVYAAIYRKYPQQIRAIYIRNVTESDRADVRYISVFQGVPSDVWHLFTDVDSIADSEPSNESQ